MNFSRVLLYDCYLIDEAIMKTMVRLILNWFTLVLWSSTIETMMISANRLNF